MLTGMAGAVESLFGLPLRFVLPVAAVALACGFALLARPAVRLLTGEKGAAFARGLLSAFLAFAALLAVENYRATDYFRYGSYLNAYEFYHYYLGSKYARELGYTRLYAASLIADDETGRKWAHKTGTIRDLSTGGYVDHKKVLQNRDEVKKHFTPPRWEEFKKDIRWFKGRMVAARWGGVLRDKGYNGTPVWGMVVGSLLTNRISTDSGAGMMFLALLDPLLIALAFGAVVWAFGPRAACMFLLLLGTHYMMKWWHMKGALLRTDWVMCAVISVCCMKRGRHGAAGGFLAFAVLSRIFPAVLLFGPGARWTSQLLGHRLALSHPAFAAWMENIPARRRTAVRAALWAAALGALWCVWRFVSGSVAAWLAAPGHPPFLLVWPENTNIGLHLVQMAGGGLLAVAGVVLLVTAVRGHWRGGLDRRWLRFFAVFALVAALLGGSSALFWRGTDVWPGYVTKIGAHNSGISEWRVGYKYVFMGDWSKNTDLLSKPARNWTPVLNVERYNKGLEAWWRTQLLVLALAFLAALGMRDHRALLLGFTPLFFLASPTYYYYIMLLLPLLFFAERMEEPAHTAGLALMFFTAMSGYWFYALWRQGYGTYYWLSVQVMVMCLYMVMLGWRESLETLAARRGVKCPDRPCPSG